ncbi:hypothetical protein ACSRUE_00775 [Sorangium sp. KYC3313]|uniref:hypothetical protein n=1 Tax=Sorangium sp. KYC3313 TaxID=3449740 RepID=UPI003F89B8AE
MTPAMEAWLTDHVWSVEELVAAALAEAPAAPVASAAAPAEPKPPPSEPPPRPRRMLQPSLFGEPE